MTIRKRWEAMTDRQRGFLTWFLPLFASVLLVAADWIWRIHDGRPTADESRGLAIRAGLAFLLWALVKIAFTRRWSFDGIGTVVALLGAGGAFIRLIGRKGPQPVSDAEFVAIWVALNVGAAILIISLIVWLLAKWFEHRRGSVPWDEVTERRKEQRRRCPDRRQGE